MAVIWAVVLAVALPAWVGAEGWRFELGTGSSLHAPVPITIRQPGSPDIERTARTQASPFKRHAPYYAWRVGKWRGDSAWEFEHIHTKIFWLAGRPATVTELWVSHGFNYLLLNRAYRSDRFLWRVGAGPIVTHPESTVRGRRFAKESGGTLGGGYYVSGAGAQAALEKRFPLTKDLWFQLEGKVTGAFSNIPIAGGNADVPHLALHYLAGFGWDFD